MSQRRIKKHSLRIETREFWSWRLEQTRIYPTGTVCAKSGIISRICTNLGGIPAIQAGLSRFGLKNTVDQNFIWNSKQAYIALGVALVAAAEANIDSTPMEGFNHEQLDQLLQLSEKGLKSSVLLALGYRDVRTDKLVNLKKVRREEEKLFTMLR